VPIHPLINESWKSLFIELYKLRHLWKPQSIETAEEAGLSANMEFKERFKISVYAKFRPVQNAEETKLLQNNKRLSPKRSPKKKANLSDEDSENHSEKENDHDENTQGHQITLPLHQKLTLIRMSRRLNNNRSALKILAEEGEWFQAKWAKISATNQHDQALADISKKNQSAAFTAEFSRDERHPNWTTFHYNLSQQQRQRQLGDASAMVSKIHSIDPTTGQVVMLTPDVGLRPFSFDGVLPGNSSQKFTYELCMRRLVMDVLNGFNATAIVYGQTGSGKTYSMFGRDDRAIFGHDKEGRGIVPRACQEILQAIKSRQEINGIHSTLSVSYVEIYGDQITDLLKNGQRCSHSKVSAQRFVLNGAAQQTVSDMDDIHSLLEKGEQTKRRAATAMNDRSTRAHSLFILTLNQEKAGSISVQSKLFLADLGGSEQVKKSQVEAGVLTENVGFEMGQHMREAVYINLGLLALKRCIEALNHRYSYVPFQDSKLTMLLSEGIGGNSKTSVIVCANSMPIHAQETLMTLRFGERCALIENTLTNNASLLQQILDRFDREIAEVEAEIRRKERWELREERVKDVNAEAGTIEQAQGGEEIKKIAMVVGAEEERRQLAKLLRERQQWLGHQDGDDLLEQEVNDSGTGLTDSETRANTHRNRTVLGFGKQLAEIYEFGQKYDESLEAAVDNSRFDEKVSLEELPETVVNMAKKKKALAWATGEKMEESAEVLEKIAKKAKRTRLAFSGLSL
jgi:kinesin family protein 5